VPKASPKPVRLSDFLTVSLAAEFLGVSPSTLRNWDRGGKLRAIRHPVNGYRLYRKADLRKLVDQLQE
jgi:excisionase family DNA binding protein